MIFVILLLRLSIVFFFFFFFQAEDGIRDKLVTGVQTCALPIWPDTRKPQVSGLNFAANRSNRSEHGNAAWPETLPHIARVEVNDKNTRMTGTPSRPIALKSWLKSSENSRDDMTARRRVQLTLPARTPRSTGRSV